MKSGCAYKRVAEANFITDTVKMFGWIYVASVACSFASVLVTAVFFNELETSSSSSSLAPAVRGCPARAAAGAPFLAATLIFRAFASAVLVVYARWWAAVVAFGLFFLNVLAALAIGDTFRRSLAYGVWSILVPVGFNRDPTSTLGHGKVKRCFRRYCCCCR
jgi:hypothetical protein